MTYGLEDSEKWNSTALLLDKNPLDSVRKRRIEAHITHSSKLRTYHGTFNSTISFRNLQNFCDIQKDPAPEKSNTDTFQMYQNNRVSYSSNSPKPSGITDPVSTKDQFSQNLHDGQALFNKFLNISKADNPQNAGSKQISTPISMESIQYKTLSLKLLRMILSMTVVICLFIIKLLTLMVGFLKSKTETRFAQPSSSDDLQKESAQNVAADNTHIQFHQDSNINASTPINPNVNVFKKAPASIHPRNQVQAKLLNAQFGTPSGISSPIISDFISPNDMGTPIDHQNFEKRTDASTFNWQYDAPINHASQSFSDGGYGTHFYTSKKSSNQKNTETSFLKKLFAKDTTVLDLAPIDTNADSMEIWQPSINTSHNKKINEMFELTQRLRASLMAEEQQKKPPTQELLLDSFFKRNELLISKRNNWTEDNKYEKLENDYETYQAIMQEKKKREELIQLEKSSLLPLVQPLKLEYLNLVQKYWNSKDLTKKIVTGISAEVFVRDLKTLINSRWINDSVIDFYLSLVSHRSTQSPFLPSVFAFTTHFYTTFTSRGYDSVKRWAKRRKVDITKLDYVFIPINILNSHWALGVIDNKRKRFQYYDSLKGEGQTPVLNHLRTFALKEAERIYGDKVPINFHEYLLDYNTNSPQQKNGSDCGVFTCATVEFLSREKALKFSQTDMPLIRQRMAYEIITGKLLE
ncbi:hypothetical protein LJB42_004359 [Komagataella kurtzmanii]|nr:hypothetical protein LJB42_004359 [Komagataella kurtzmanii]